MGKREWGFQVIISVTVSLSCWLSKTDTDTFSVYLFVLMPFWVPVTIYKSNSQLGNDKIMIVDVN